MISRIRKLANTSLETRITLLDQIGVSGSNFLTGILLTRFIGLEAYGIFALAWMGLLLISSLQHAFVLSPMMSLSPKKTETARQEYFGSTHIMQIGFSCLAAGLSAWVIWGSDNSNLMPDWQLGFLGLVLPLAIVVYVMQDYYRRYFFIQKRPKDALLIDILAYGGMIVGILLAHVQGLLNVEVAYWIVSLSFLIGAVIGAILAKLPVFHSLTTCKMHLQEHWHFSSWLIGTALLQFFSSNYFLVAAAALLGPVGLGALRIAQNLMGVTHILFQAMENVVPVKAAAALNKDGWEGMWKYLKAISLRSGLLILLILISVVCSAPYLLHFAYGSEYVSYSYLLIGYCVFYAFLFPGYPLRYALRSLEYTRPVFVAYILSTVFSLIAAYPIVKTWGLMGVVYGLILTQIIMQGYFIFQLKRFS